MIEIAVVGLGVAVAILALQRRRYTVRESAHLEEVTLLKRELETRTPTETCLRDVTRVWHQSEDNERLVLVRFRTLAAMEDFHRWLRPLVIKADMRARAEAERNGRGKAAPVLNVACK